MQHCDTIGSSFSPGERRRGKLQIDGAEVMRIAIQQEIAHSEESRYDHRLQGLLLVAVGLSSREVAELLGENGTTVQHWVNRFEQGGLDALWESE